MFKHQAATYRNINGRRYTNWTDLCYSDEENAKIVSEAKKQFKFVRIVRRDADLKAVFVSN